MHITLHLSNCLVDINLKATESSTECDDYNAIL